MQSPDLFSIETAKPFLYSLLVVWLIIFLFWHSAGKRERQRTKHALQTLATLDIDQPSPTNELALWKLPPPNATQEEHDAAYAELTDHHAHEQERQHALRTRLAQITSIEELTDFLTRYHNERLQEIEDRLLLEGEPQLDARERGRS